MAVDASCRFKKQEILACERSREVKKNIGIIDQMIRTFIGLGFIIGAIVIYIKSNTFWMILVLSVLGIVTLITTFLRFSLIYHIFKISTRRDE
jgi:hypothetical protein